MIPEKSKIESDLTAEETETTVKNEVSMDSGVTEEFELTLISEILTLRDMFEVYSFFQHIPCPQISQSTQYKVSYVMSISIELC